MRWQGGRESENVEDRSGMPAAGLALGGFGTLVVIVLGLLFGADPATLMRQIQQGQPNQAGGGGGGEARPVSPEEAEVNRFVRVILADTEDVWTQVFRENKKEYVNPTLVLFHGSTQTQGCGLARKAIGPFYCPADQRVYLDTNFFQELSDRFGAPGEFARAYVIAHEVGHHVQKLLGRTDWMEKQRATRSESEMRELSVRLELQADFYAGVWANRANQMRNILEPGDIEAALNAASQIGDDKLQKEAQGYAVPDSFTHGTSAQRARWFRKGFQTGDVKQGDTFGASEL
jgi:predicted metalloprotease